MVFWKWQRSYALRQMRCSDDYDSPNASKSCETHDFCVCSSIFAAAQCEHQHEHFYSKLLFRLSSCSPHSILFHLFFHEITRNVWRTLILYNIIISRCRPLLLFAFHFTYFLVFCRRCCCPFIHGERSFASNKCWPRMFAMCVCVCLCLYHSLKRVVPVRSGICVFLSVCLVFRFWFGGRFIRPLDMIRNAPQSKLMASNWNIETSKQTASERVSCENQHGVLTRLCVMWMWLELVRRFFLFSVFRNWNCHLVSYSWLAVEEKKSFSCHH